MTTNDPLYELCRSLPGVTEDVKWGDDLVFSVGGKMFACFHVPDGEPLSFKVPAGVFDLLVQQEGIALIQALFDHSDPVNLTRHLYKNPLADAPEERVLLLQVAIGDSQVPNLTSDLLARAIGAKLMVPSIYDVPGVETVTAPTTEPTMVQILIPEMFEANPPPESNVPPLSDNGTHGAVSFLPHILGQSFHFLENGEVINPCDGACDPD